MKMLHFSRPPAGRLVILVVLLSAASVSGQAAETEGYPSPKRFESAIEHFEKQDHFSPPPTGAIVCVGSSSMRKWHGKIHEDLAPLTVIARGFGGSNMNDLLYYLDRIVLKYKPRAVVIYEGDNDTAVGISPSTIAEMFRKVATRIHQALPQARIYFLAIKPSVARWKLWPKMQQANRLIAHQCAQDPRLTFVDVATPMLDSNGQVKKDIFESDNLHMNRKGYEIWRDVLRPILMAHEAKFEKQKH